MTDHYRDKANYGKLYQEPGARSTTHVPNILAIRLSAVRLLELHKKGRCLTSVLKSSCHISMTQQWEPTRMHGTLCKIG